MQSALGQVFLRAVEHAPQVRTAVVEAARHQDLVFRDGRGLVGIVVLEGQCGAGEHFGFAIIQGDAAHQVAGFLDPLEAAQHLVSAFDDLSGNVAFVGHAHIGHGVTAHQPIAAHETEHSGQHLIAAGAVVRVQQDDFIGFRAVDLARMAQPQQVFGVLALAFAVTNLARLFQQPALAFAMRTRLRDAENPARGEHLPAPAARGAGF